MNQILRFLVLIIFPLLLLTACQDEFMADESSMYSERARVYAITLPDTLWVGRVYDFHILYEKPSPCHELSQVTREEHQSRLEYTLWLNREERPCPEVLERDSLRERIVVHKEGTFTFRFHADPVFEKTVRIVGG